MAKKNGNGGGTIRKKVITRDGKTYQYWEGRITAGYDPATRKQIQRSFSGATQAEVRRKMQAVLVSLDNGTYQAPNKITVEAWLSEWIKTYCEPRLKPLTIEAYLIESRNYIIPYIGSLQLQSVRGAHIQKLYNALIEKGLSTKTVKNVRGILSKSFSVAKKQGLIAINPVDAAEVPKGMRHEIKPLTISELPLFLEAISGHPLENFFAVCLFCGLREAEALGLSWQQVDFDNGTITICQQLQKSKLKGVPYHIEKSTKGGRDRTIMPPPEVFDYLRREQQKQRINKMRVGGLWSNPNDLVFTNEGGRYLTVDYVYKRFKAIAEAIGRSDLRVHDLRHTCATTAIAAGVNPKAVQQMLGHADISITLNIYTHTGEEMKQQAAERVSAFYKQLKEG